jgi:hypothetical protein
MRLVADAIRKGFDDFNKGAVLADCPFVDDDPIRTMGYCGSKPIGLVRIGIEWAKMWKIGWSIGSIKEGKWLGLD